MLQNYELEWLTSIVTHFYNSTLETGLTWELRVSRLNLQDG